MKTILRLFVLMLVSLVSLSSVFAIECLDSDGGLAPLIPGSSSFFDVFVFDTCSDETHLQEALCVDNQPVLSGPLDCTQYGGSNSFCNPNIFGGGGAYCTSCGNGITEIGEDCDDGNNLDGDACPADCIIEQEHEIPEFTTIGAGLVLAGAGAYMYRKRSRK